MTSVLTVPGLRARIVFAAFTGYGMLWGPYLSSMPDVRAASGVDEGTLGAALLCAAAAALPAMLCTGRLLDRFGRPVAVTVVLLFAAVSVLPGQAGSPLTLIVALTLFGLGSGACNVVVVALASTVEAEAGKRVMSGGHALFSAGLLAGSAVTGLARAAGIPASAVALFVAAAVAGWVLSVRRGLPAWFARADRPPVGARRARLGRPVLLLCLLAGLAMLVESGVQQWSAVFLADVLRAPASWGAAGPGVFAGAMAVGRFAGQWLSGRLPARVLLCGSGVVSGTGVLLVAFAGTPLYGMLGIAVVGGALSVATPTAFALAGSWAPPADRGAVLGTTTSLAGLGLLLGPALVGRLAASTDLRVALGGLCLAAFAVFLLALRLPRHDRRPAVATEGSWS